MQVVDSFTTNRRRDIAFVNPHAEAKAREQALNDGDVGDIEIGTLG
jgi:hypothetical protein